MAEYSILERLSPALAFVIAERAALAPAVSAPAPSAPTVTAQPAITPASAEVGQSVAISLGAASGYPTPAATWDLRLNGVSIKSQVVNGVLALTAQGDLDLLVSWTNSVSTVAATTAEATIAAATTNPPAGTAPAITRQPSVLPAAPRIGDNITIDIGAASGSPAAVATWDFTRDGVSIKSGLTAGVAMEITQAGVYALSVSWANGVGSPAVATVATFTVTQSSAPAIDYATAALLYIDQDSAFDGDASAVTTITPTGTGSRLLNNNSGTTPVVKVADGWQITDGNRLQTPGFTAVSYDGLFVIMDVTLASYGSALGQMLEGTGSRVSIRNNAGNIQGIGPASGQPNVALGAANYGQRIVVAVQMDALADVISGYTSAGAQVSAAHVDAGLAPTQFVVGRYCNMTIHRLAIVGRPVGGAWPVALADVYADFTGGA